MSFQSLHSKIFALVTAILAAIAIVVMLTSQRNVTDTVMTSEQHAISNVLDLIQHDAAARWGAMLNNKVSIVRNGRRQLMQTGKLIEATLESYARLADEGFITEAMAQDLAREWINQLHFDGDRYAFVFDTRYIVLASGYPAMRGRDLSSINDYKNRPLAQSALEESRDSGYSFAIYRRPTSTEPAGRIQQDFQALVGDDDNSRYAYFDYFGPWNWVLAVSDSAADVIEQIEEYRTQMENAVRTTLLPMKLAHSGFVFIVADDGRFVVAPPDTHHGFLDNRFDDGQTLRQRLNAPTRANLHGLQVEGSRGPWKIDSAYYPPLHWTIVAAVPENDLSAPARKLLRSQALIFGAMSLAALLSAWFFAARIVQPLKRLTSYARQLPDQALRVEGNVPHHIAALPDQHRDEVGRLATAFMYMDSKLRENIHQLMRETTTRERFEGELNVARAIQLGLLPDPLSGAEQQHVDLYAFMRPAKEVGGDLYDYFVLPDGKLCVVVGDVSGKGVPAALFMAIARTLIRATAEDETEPAKIIRKINDRLAENNPNVMFVTLLLGVLDVSTGDFAWVNAGHMEPLIVNADGMVRVLAGRSGPACGVQDHLSYQTYRARLERGDTLVGYTDGVTESENPDHEQYGESRMLALLAQPATSAAALAKRLLHDVDDFTAGAEQADDITLLAIRWP